MVVAPAVFRHPSGPVFAEAYLAACAEATGVGRIASFDRSLDRLSSVERVEP